MNRINSADYNIIRIDYRPSKYIMNKHKKIEKETETQLPFPKQFYELIHIYADFKWSFIEYVSGYKHDYWFNFYMFETLECAIEHIRESTKIIFEDKSGYCYIMIPKDNNEVFDWVINNIPKELKYRMLKKASMSYWYSNPQSVRHYRTHSLEFTKNSLKRMKLI